MDRAGRWLVVWVWALGSLVARAQTPIVEMKDVRIWDHIVGERVGIHTDRSKLGLGRFEPSPTVELDVVVSENGRVDSAHAVKGPKPMYEEAERIEMERLFKPFTKDGSVVRARIRDWVSVDPPETWMEPRLPFPAEVDLKQVTMGLERTGCFGMCPAYVVSVDGDGTVRFTGEMYVLVPGEHRARISAEAVKELFGAFRKAEFLSARDEYRTSVTDNPTQTIRLRIGGRTKTVVDYVGSEAGLPDAVKDLERRIDEVAGTDRWVKGDEGTLPALRAEGWAFRRGSEANMKLYASAVERKDRALVGAMLAAKAPATRWDEKGIAPACVASGQGDVELVERMVGETKEIDPRVKEVCLSLAARSGRVAMLDFWLDRGASVTAPMPEMSRGVLENAITSGKAEMVARVLELPVDVKAEVQEESLIQWAMGQRYDGADTGEIVAMLAKAGSPVDGALTGPFVVAEAVAPLVAAGAKVDERDEQGRTALIAHGYDEETVRALLGAGGDPTLRANDGTTALSTAKQFGCKSCEAVLEEAVKRRGVGAAR